MLFIFAHELPEWAGASNCAQKALGPALPGGRVDAACEYRWNVNHLHSSHPEHARLLGDLVIRWSAVTDCLEELFAHLADIDDAFVLGVFVEKIRDGQMDDVVSSLAGRTEEGTRDSIRPWVAQVRAARKKRNNYLHSVYTPIEHSDGQSHLYVVGRRVLDRQNGTARPNLDKLMSANLHDFESDLVEIVERYEQLRADHFPYAVRRP